MIWKQTWGGCPFLMIKTMCCWCVNYNLSGIECKLTPFLSCGTFGHVNRCSRNRSVQWLLNREWSVNLQQCRYCEKFQVQRADGMDSHVSCVPMAGWPAGSVKFQSQIPASLQAHILLRDQRRCWGETGSGKNIFWEGSCSITKKNPCRMCRTCIYGFSV